MISRKEQHGDCTFVTVSETGLSHRIQKISNQDAASFIVSENDFALAVSDGVGSCAKAEIGSQAAVLSVETVFSSIKKEGVQPDSAGIAKLIIDEWIRHLEGENPNDCCATLKAVMKYGNQLFLFSIGDGMLAVSSRGMWCCAPMDNGLFVNQTMRLNMNVKSADFWTSEFLLDTYVPYAVFACSDGVMNGIQEGRERELVTEIETRTPVEDLQSELEELIVDLAEFSSDDRTVGVVKYERKNEKSDR